ncbi:MAG: hypothetical protein WC551_03070 [Patescibacteria group bacterium]
MRQTTLALALVSVLLFAGAGCGKTTAGNGTAGGPSRGDEAAQPESSLSDMCKAFDADFIYSASGKPVARFDHGALKMPNDCTYYTEYKDDYYKLPDGKTMPGGPWFSLIKEDLDIATQKKATEMLGWTMRQDPRIKMDHFLAIQKEGLINQIYLILGPKEYVRVNRSSTKVLTEEETIELAAKVAQKLTGSVGFEIKKNPVQAGTGKSYEEEKQDSLGNPQETVIRDFFGKLGNQDVDGALAMLDKDAGDWRANFKTLKSLKLNKLEPIFQEEWTADRQRFKAELQVSVTPEGENMGWQNGKNFRWISIRKTGDKWIIHELANNP